MLMKVTEKIREKSIVRGTGPADEYHKEVRQARGYSLYLVCRKKKKSQCKELRLWNQS